MAQTAMVGRARRKGKGRLRSFLSQHGLFYVLVIPAFVWRFAYTVIPLFQTIWLSFSSKAVMRTQKFVGLKNYRFMLEDSTVAASLEFTAIYTVAATILEVAVGLGMALLLNQKLRGQWLTRVAALLPWGTSALVSGIVWRLLFFESGGVLNDFVKRLGFERVLWLSNKGWARFSVIMTSVWRTASWTALLLLAGLKTVPRELLEAAEVDGAGVWGRFRHVTLPLLAPMLLVVIMLRGMAEVQTFESVLALTRGGPGYATRIISLYLFDRFFLQGQYGYGSALAVVLFALTALIGGSFAYVLYLRRTER